MHERILYSDSQKLLVSWNILSHILIRHPFRRRIPTFRIHIQQQPIAAHCRSTFTSPIRTMETKTYRLNPPSLTDLAKSLQPALSANYTSATITVSPCPDLRQPPFHLATQGLSGSECAADIGGQPNLFPVPKLSCKYSLPALARAMEMSPSRGSLIGAGAGPFHHLGTNAELAPNLSWENGFENIDNQTHYAAVNRADGSVVVEKCPSTDCALMMNLFGSSGLPGDVLKITARGRSGTQKSFTECIRHALRAAYGDSRPISLGGVFVIKRGRANYHVMPDFPSAPFESPAQLNAWLTYHEFAAPVVCLSVLHSADPGKEMGLRMEHTHCFSADGGNRGGHYHYDMDAGGEGGQEEVDYEGYFNTAKVIYRIDRPEVTLERDLHD